MSNRKDAHFRRIVAALLLLAGCQGVGSVKNTVCPEQRCIAYRAPESLPPAPLPDYPPPRTVTHPDNGLQDLRLSLDEAIRIALDNADVIRVLAGFSAVSSGQTIYDPGIANTAIDQARSRFDPNLSVNNTFTRNDQPSGTFIPGPPGATITGTEIDGYTLDANLSDTNPLGGTAGFRVGVQRTDIEPGVFPLNPQATHFTELSYVQPLLQGGGIAANVAPILIAGIETERSFFQFKGSVQDMVRGVIEAYWALVFARTDEWARQQQVEQAMFAYERELARRKRGLGDLSDVAQTRVALTNFRANLVAARSNVLQREAALLNILGIAPTDVGEVIPLTPPCEDRILFQWPELVSLAERYRPDLIELKLIIEADLQRVVTAENNAQPTLDAVALYRWDGLRGKTPAGPTITAGGNDYTDWTLGVNFSVPLGLRQGRATVRRQELLVVRDRANLQQGLHSAVHQLALSVRTMDQFYEQYAAFLDAREAARENLDVQAAEFANGRTIFLNVLQAITDWGNAVSAEAQSLTQYNTELANLEVETGTILEAHGIRFVEERFRFAGPLGSFDERCYPAAVAPTENAPRYAVGDEPAEDSFNLEDPLREAQERRRNRRDGGNSEGTEPSPGDPPVSHEFDLDSQAWWEAPSLVP